MIMYRKKDEVVTTVTKLDRPPKASHSGANSRSSSTDPHPIQCESLATIISPSKKKKNENAKDVFTEMLDHLEESRTLSMNSGLFMRVNWMSLPTEVRRVTEKLIRSHSLLRLSISLSFMEYKKWS